MPLPIFKNRNPDPLPCDLFQGYSGDTFTHLSYAKRASCHGLNRYQVTYGVTAFHERASLLRKQEAPVIGLYRGDVFEAWRNAELVGVAMIRTARYRVQYGTGYQVKLMIHGLCFTEDAVDDGLTLEMADSVVFNVAQDAMVQIDQPDVSAVTIEILSKPASRIEMEFSDWIAGHLTFCAVSRLAENSRTSFIVHSIR